MDKHSEHYEDVTLAQEVVAQCEVLFKSIMRDTNKDSDAHALAGIGQFITTVAENNCQQRIDELAPKIQRGKP